MTIQMEGGRSDDDELCKDAIPQIIIDRRTPSAHFP